MADRDINFEIRNKIAVLKESTSGWKKELNVVAWNGGEARFDIREWDSNHERMSRGVTLTLDEMDKLITAMNKFNGGEE